MSDPWGFGRFTLATKASATAQQRVRAYWNQAESFYWAAEESAPSAQPLLYYYSFMNMVKALLIIRGRTPQDAEIHGIRHQRPKKQKSQIQTQELIVDEGLAQQTAVFNEFADQLGYTFRSGDRLQVGELLQQVVGVHRSWMSVTENPSNFARAKVSLCRNQDTSEVFGRVTFSEKDKTIAESVASRSGWRRVRDVDSDPCYETEPEPRQGRDYASAVEKLTTRLAATGIHLLLTESEGYYLYFSDFGKKETKRLPQLVSMYALMFFLGTITRYRPYDFDRFVAKKWGWLVSEFINSQPAQFVYLVTSEIVRNEVVRPFGHVTIESL